MSSVSHNSIRHAVQYTATNESHFTGQLFALWWNLTVWRKYNKTMHRHWQTTCVPNLSFLRCFVFALYMTHTHTHMLQMSITHNVSYFYQEQSLYDLSFKCYCALPLTIVPLTSFWPQIKLPIWVIFVSKLGLPELFLLELRANEVKTDRQRIDRVQSILWHSIGVDA